MDSLCSENINLLSFTFCESNFSLSLVCFLSYTGTSLSKNHFTFHLWYCFRIPQDYPHFQWFAKRIHNTQNIVVFVTKVYYSKMIYDRISKGKRQAESGKIRAQASYVLFLLWGATPSSFFLQKQKKRATCPMLLLWEVCYKLRI